MRRRPRSAVDAGVVGEPLARDGVGRKGLSDAPLIVAGQLDVRGACVLLEVSPLIGSRDVPAIWLNRETMERYRPEMRKYYFDATRYKTYLEQLGVAYPAVRKEP